MVLYGARGLTAREEAHRLLERAAGEHWGLACLGELAREERGKPYLPGHPQFQFNLSHSGDLALCALSCLPVGVDIQVLRPFRPGLVERSCTGEERNWLESQPDPTAAFAQLWALKEAVGKHSGYGLPYPPSRLPVPLPPQGSAYDPDKIYTLDGRFLRIYQGPDWRGAVCGEEAPPEKIFWSGEKKG